MFNKIIATATIRFIVTVAIVVYKGLTPVVYRMLTYKVGGLYLSPSISYPIGAIVGIGLFVLFFTKTTRNK